MCSDRTLIYTLLKAAMNFDIVNFSAAVFLMFLAVVLRFSECANLDRGPVYLTNMTYVNMKKQQEMVSILEGYKLAFHECQYQFQWDKWNCSLPKSLTETNSPVSLTKVLHKANREAAFVHSIVAAGVTFSLIKSCYQGKNERCPCPLIINPNNTRRTCEENMEYGFKRGKRVIRNYDIKHVEGQRKLFNLKNAKTGIRALHKELPTVCRCHGATGSCSYKTCWKTLPKFEKVGETLRMMYNQAIQVYYNNGTLYKVRPKNKRKQKPNIVSLKSSMLVYMDQSPNYCQRDPRTGNPGTLNRYCNSQNKNTCKDICESCGYRTVEERVLVRDKKCLCQFQWCCKVVCQSCEKYVTNMYCARS